ncbi:hypothetical protein KZI27_03790 [Curtobacterium sp. TC1]|uniref:hypothetical protein n=1 Tax=Curtobacterium sp. TC1 TaxID=2862880 RepID=UPI001C9B9085|nr:hypothetical protein [Curtobacterium sp. TC1]QZQ55983.1 hypothetical protein KZI27_03790 [Curtobacterium sp. TC1]
MTLLGIVLVAALGIALSVRRDWLPVIVGVAAGLPFSAAVAIGGNGVPLFSVAAAACGVALLSTPRLGTSHWTANAFVVFLAWATVITALGPWMFAGIRVLVPRGGVDGQVMDPGFLGYSISNGAQMAYLLLAACATLYLVRVRGAVVAAGTALVVGTVLTSLRGLLVTVQADFLGPVFDSLPNVAYSWVGPGARLRGVFSEPSELAAFSLPAAAFSVMAAMRSRGPAKWLWSIACVLACSNLLQASSGTAVAASAAFIAIGLVLLAVRYVLRGGIGTPWLVIGALTLGVLALTVGDQLAAPVQELVDDKVGSTSWDSRTGADDFSWGVIADTLGLGTGLGGNRPSSFALSLLSTLGVPGTVAFAVLVLGLVATAMRTPETVPVAVALVALIVSKVVGTPDLSTPVLWVLIAACAVPTWSRHGLRSRFDERPLPTLVRTGARP